MSLEKKEMAESLECILSNAFEMLKSLTCRLNEKDISKDKFDALSRAIAMPFAGAGDVYEKLFDGNKEKLEKYRIIKVLFERALAEGIKSGSIEKEEAH